MYKKRTGELPIPIAAVEWQHVVKHCHGSEIFSIVSDTIVGAGRPFFAVVFSTRWRSLWYQHVAVRTKRLI